MDLKQHTYALILAGGGGSRLWPKSRKIKPKHLLNLISNEKTMIQKTADRITPLIPWQNIFVVTTESYVAETKMQLPQLPLGNIISEPFGLNTAWAMGLGAVYIRARDEKAVIINLAADHLIENEGRFRKAVKAAAKVAQSGNYLVTIGIYPSFANTGLGYIRSGKEIKHVDGLPVFSVKGFTEKPDLATAQAFLATKEYFWNANLYTWKADAVIKAIEKHLPKVGRGLIEIAAHLGKSDEKAVLASVYENAVEAQIDKGVSEKADNLIMIPGNFDWNDVGDWSILHDVSPTNRGTHTLIGDPASDLISYESERCLVHGSKRLVALVGLKDIVVVDTDDAILVCPRDRAQDVKKLVEKLKEEGKEKYL
ncbi:MAG: sugar phosphate nucleotidyltransferase [Patescibacteria group bacterium]|nr:sugar phosphate nucleotidyltransferase [Patescibacteria group bacterium]